jgi:5-methylcytosine-specific restriction enzyme B
MSEIRFDSEQELVEGIKQSQVYEEFATKHLGHKIEREKEAWRLVTEHRGRYTREILDHVFDTVDLNQDNQPHFGSLLGKPNRNLIFSYEPSRINQWFKELLFSGKEPSVSLNACMNQLKIKGASNGLATLLLYLSKPNKWTIWVNATEKGLVALGRIEKFKGQDWGKYYEQFNVQAMDFWRNHRLQPQETDWFLSHISRGPQPPKRYWRITLPDQTEASLPTGEKVVLDVWKSCRDHGIAAIGFAGNEEHPQVKKFMSIRPGDLVVAFLRHKTIGGIGVVTSSFDENLFKQRTAEQDYWQGLFWFRLSVEWHPGEKSVDELPEKVRNKFGQQTVVELSQGEYDAVAKLFDGVVTPPHAPFTKRTFELLEGIHATPTKDYYQEHKAEFDQFVEKPFQRVLRQVAQRLPAQIRSVMETDKNIFGRFLKNDWGKGGTWHFYWGAFYPKGGKRTENAQLSMWIDRQVLEYGFYIGEHSNKQLLHFQRNCQEFGPALLPYLRNALPETVVGFGNVDKFEIAADGSVQAKKRYTWDEFLRNPAQADNNVSVFVSRNQLLALSEEELVTRIADTHTRLFPLVLMAVEEDPLPAIHRYLEDESSVKPPVPYNRQSFLTCTYLREEQADDLYELLLEKKQIILYGPPGTGKTYVAQELGKWLTGLATPPANRVEMIQFHPAYSYEDFIEGIRPESKQTGEGRFMVDYPPRPGVFRNFCKTAQDNPTQAHVFIIDEINRGNIPRIFGELMLLLEYRERDVPLPYSCERFRIPPNVYLIGTMNTADRSIALVDFALRRRFHFFQFSTDPDLYERWLAEHPVSIPYLAKLYRRLSQEAIDDPDYAVGVSYFMDPDLTEAKLARIWRRSIVPYLAEYHVEQRARVEKWKWNSDFMAGIRGEA